MQTFFFIMLPFAKKNSTRKQIIVRHAEMAFPGIHSLKLKFLAYTGCGIKNNPLRKIKFFKNY